MPITAKRTIVPAPTLAEHSQTNTHRSAGSGTSSPTTPIATRSINALTTQVKTLRDRLDHPPVQPLDLSFPGTEAGLTLDQRKQIQKALGFSGRRVDGVFGPSTRVAITGLRQSKKVTTTGPLTADEIKELLSSRNS